MHQVFKAVRRRSVAGHQLSRPPPYAARAPPAVRIRTVPRPLWGALGTICPNGAPRLERASGARTAAAPLWRRPPHLEVCRLVGARPAAGHLALPPRPLAVSRHDGRHVRGARAAVAGGGGGGRGRGVVATVPRTAQTGASGCQAPLAPRRFGPGLATCASSTQQHCARLCGLGWGCGWGSARVPGRRQLLRASGARRATGRCGARACARALVERCTSAPLSASQYRPLSLLALST